MAPGERIELHPIGTVRSALKDLADAPLQGDEGAPVATIEVDTRYLDALHGIEPGDELIVLTWLDRGDREVLSVHPRGDTTRERRGVFATRSPDRPNPIGMHRVRVESREGATLRVLDLEAIDGTPVLDLKPVLSADAGER
jgi:tRNA-Thr(GGU) m(6)t(6)A37 methyltransferase TsaA